MSDYYEKWKKEHKPAPAPATVVTPTDRLRLDVQVDKIIERLRQGPALNSELATIALKYTSRISDARKRGYKIQCARIGNGATMYTLLT